MKTIIIIPIYKQVSNLARILHGLERQTEKDFDVSFMMDRPEVPELIEARELISQSLIEASISVISAVPEGVTNRIPDQEIFLTPYVRNEAIRSAKAEGYENFIFIDGDCIPQENLVKAHNFTSSQGIPVLSVGRRREEKHAWKDQRERDRNLSMLNLFRRDGVVINNLQMLKSNFIVWSCNISMNLKAIELLEKFNEHYYGVSEVFSSNFVGTWGGEDGFLGIEAYYSGIFINMIGDIQAGVKHIDHPRPVSKYGHAEHIEFLKNTTSELGEKLIKKPLPLSFFAQS